MFYIKKAEKSKEFPYNPGIDSSLLRKQLQWVEKEIVSRIQTNKPIDILEGIANLMVELLHIGEK